MNPIGTLLKDARSLPRDERQTEVRQHSSYVAFFTLAGTYLLIAFVYSLQNLVVPLSTQVLFMATLLVFAYLVLREEGAHFRIPGVPETKTSLDQPTALRSLPWLIFVTGIALFPIGNIAPAIADIPPQAVNEPGFALHLLIFSLSLFASFLFTAVFSLLLARWIKEGRAVVVWIMHLVFLIAIPGYALEIIAAYVPNIEKATLPMGISFVDLWPPVPAAERNLSIINLIIAIWIFYVLIRYSKKIIADGRKYQEELGVQRWGRIFAWVGKVSPLKFFTACFLSFAISFASFTIFGVGTPILEATLMVPFLVGMLAYVCGVASLIYNRKKQPFIIWLVPIVIAAPFVAAIVSGK